MKGKPMRGSRKITVAGREYIWKVGKMFVLIRGENFSRAPSKVEVTNYKHTWEDFANRQATITPRMIQEYISKQDLSVAA